MRSLNVSFFSCRTCRRIATTARITASSGSPESAKARSGGRGSDALGIPLLWNAEQLGWSYFLLGTNVFQDSLTVLDPMNFTSGRNSSGISPKRTRPFPKNPGAFSPLCLLVHGPSGPWRETFRDQIRHRNVKHPRNQHHSVIGHTAEKAFDLGNPCPADVKALKLAFPGKIRLSPILLDPNGSDSCADDVLSAVVPHEPATLPLAEEVSAHICEHFDADFVCQSTYVPLGGG